jgi:hypothetical protein
MSYFGVAYGTLVLLGKRWPTPLTLKRMPVEAHLLLLAPVAPLAVLGLVALLQAAADLF